MSRALNADPSSLDVRLSLGVSHTNELDTGEAVQHLYRWLESHPQYGPVVSAAGPPPDSSQVGRGAARSHLSHTFVHPAVAHSHHVLGLIFMCHVK